MPTQQAGVAALDRLAERVADRLRVVGPRMAARGSGGSGGSADAAGVLEQIRTAIQRLADVGADGERRPRRVVPALAAHALADQVLVLAHDVARTGDRPAIETAQQVLAELAASL